MAAKHIVYILRSVSNPERPYIDEPTAIRLDRYLKSGSGVADRSPTTRRLKHVPPS